MVKILNGANESLFDAVREKSLNEDLEPTLIKMGYGLKKMEVSSAKYVLKTGANKNFWKNGIECVATIDYYSQGDCWGFLADCYNEEVLDTLVKYAERWEEIGQNSKLKLHMKSTINKKYITKEEVDGLFKKKS